MDGVSIWINGALIQLNRAFIRLHKALSRLNRPFTWLNGLIKQVKAAKMPLGPILSAVVP
jgi:hypothetical protein